VQHLDSKSATYRIAGGIPGGLQPGELSILIIVPVGVG
jgi:hypothetical protein